MVDVRLVIRPAGADDGRALDSLFRWLSRDTELARHAHLSSAAACRGPGEMGGALDVVNAVFADAGAAAGIGSLLVAYRAWRSTRTQAPAFTIERDGVTVTISQGSEEEVGRVLQLLLPGRPGAGSGGMPGSAAAGEEPGVH